MASTAAWSADSFAPLPIQRPAARAAASVTRTISSPRLRSRLSLNILSSPWGRVRSRETFPATAPIGGIARQSCHELCEHSKRGLVAGVERDSNARTAHTLATGRGSRATSGDVRVDSGELGWLWQIIGRVSPICQDGRSVLRVPGGYLTFPAPIGLHSTTPLFHRARYHQEE